MDNLQSINKDRKKQLEIYNIILNEFKTIFDSSCMKISTNRLELIAATVEIIRNK